VKKNLVLLFASVLLCVLVLEGVFRAISPKSPPGTTFGKAVRKNAEGFRDRDFAVPKPDGTYRILVLGDSFTWGIGLDVEETLPKQLERRLRRERPDLEVINASIPGQNTTHELATLREKGLRYEPDMVVLAYCLNDIEFDPAVTVGADGATPAVAPAGASPAARALLYDPTKGLRGFVYWFQLRSRFVAFLVPRVGNLLRRVGLLKSAEFSWVEKTFQGYTDDNLGWRESRGALAEMARECRERRLPLIVAIYPLFAQLHEYRGKGAHETIRSECERLGIPAVDLLGVFENRDAWEFWVNFMDGHPNAKAHGLATEALLPLVRASMPSAAAP
jgi:lysophospholipase L1-like esterase